MTTRSCQYNISTDLLSLATICYPKQHHFFIAHKVIIATSNVGTPTPIPTPSAILSDVLSMLAGGSAPLPVVGAAVGTTVTPACCEALSVALVRVEMNVPLLLTQACAALHSYPSCSGQQINPQQLQPSRHAESMSLQQLPLLTSDCCQSADDRNIMELTGTRRNTIPVATIALIESQFWSFMCDPGPIHICIQDNNCRALD